MVDGAARDRCGADHHSSQKQTAGSPDDTSVVQLAGTKNCMLKEISPRPHACFAQYTHDTHIEDTRAGQPVRGDVEVGERGAFRQGSHRFSVLQGVLGQVERVQGRKAAQSYRGLDAVLAQVQL